MNKSVRDTLFGIALKYCRMRLLPWNELGYEETVEYGLRRSRLHNTMCSLLDVDRELVERAFTMAESRFGAKVDGGVVVDGSIKGGFDFPRAYDEFCKELVKLGELPDGERHPNVLSEEDLDRMDLNAITEMPTTHNAPEETKREERRVCVNCGRKIPNGSTFPACSECRNGSAFDNL